MLSAVSYKRRTKMLVSIFQSTVKELALTVQKKDGSPCDISRIPLDEIICIDMR